MTDLTACTEKSLAFSVLYAYNFEILNCMNESVDTLNGVCLLALVKWCCIVDSGTFHGAASLKILNNY